MEQVKTDPRVTRTRKLIIDSFLALSKRKDFSAITVKDISKTASINRATFYSHFLDKYDLLEKVVNQKLLLNLGCEHTKAGLSLEDTLLQLFNSLTRFETYIDSYCTGHEEIETVDSIVHQQLTRILLEKINDTKGKLSQSSTVKLARLMTHALVGMSRDYKDTAKTESPEEYIAPLIPYILCGINHTNDK